MKKVSFTGSRDGMTEEQKITFEYFLHTNKITELYHGDCVGADDDAHAIAISLNVEVFKRPCNITQARAFTQGGKDIAEPKKPLDRNKDIVNDSDLLIATPNGYTEELRSGTWSTIRYARKMSKDVIIIWPNGEIS